MARDVMAHFGRSRVYVIGRPGRWSDPVVRHVFEHLVRRAHARAGPEERTVRGVKALHADVDGEARRLHVLHAARLVCRRGCSSCCVDGLTVFDVEAEPIRRLHGALLATGAPHEEGACAFLDAEGACRIYAERPYVCRTQGLPLRWIEERDGHPVELRDICPLNDLAGPIEELPGEDCWTLGPVEERLAQLQVDAGMTSERTALRSLFVTKYAEIAVNERTAVDAKHSNDGR